MAQTLEKGENKIQQICDALRRETLEPAKHEAENIVEKAKADAKKIVSEAQAQSAKLIEEAKTQIENEHKILHASLEQASKQCLEELRQNIEKKLFHEELHNIISQSTSNPELIVKLLEAIIHAIEKDGLSIDISAIIPSTISPDEVNLLLGQALLNKLKNGAVEIDGFKGGCKVKLHDKKFTLAITDESLLELLSNYVRKDFRRFFFRT